MGLIFNQVIERTYRANYCSCSFLLCMIFSLLVIIVPFFLAASTYGFWPNALVYYEQPIVLYNNEIVLTSLTVSQSISEIQLETSMSSNFFSTIGWLNNLYAGNLDAVDVQSNYIDTNADFKPDFYTFNLTLYHSPESVKNIKLFIQFIYRLRQRINMDMIGMAYIDLDLPGGASEVYVDGILKLNQRDPLKSARVVRQVYNESIFSPGQPIDGFWERSLGRYLDRNETLEFDYEYSSLMAGDGVGVKVNVMVRVPVYETVKYQPMFIQNVKFAWIQYLSLLIPIWLIVTTFARYVYSQQIFETSVSIKQ